MQNYLYRAFGLSFASEFEFPELDPLPPDEFASPEVDVRIHFGSVPDRLSEPIIDGEYRQVSSQQYLVKMDQNLGIRYLVQNGNEIIVQIREDSDVGTMRLFILSLCMAAVTLQRGRIAIHASGVRTPQGAVLFSGDSGMGKSTLAANFLKRGYEILTDDVALLSFDESGLPQIMPAYPRLKLWEDSLENLGEPLDTYKKVKTGIAKYGIPVKDGFARQPLTLLAIYLLADSSDSQMRILPVKGFRRLTELQKNVYRRGILSAMGLRRDEFEQLTLLADRAQIFQLFRPRRLDKLGELLDQLEAHFTDLGAGQ